MVRPSFVGTKAVGTGMDKGKAKMGHGVTIGKGQAQVKGTITIENWSTNF